MSRGPRDRNYNVQLLADYTFRKRRKGSSDPWEILVAGKQIDKSGTLTVNNPWRAVKPVDAPPTSRSLMHERQEASRGKATYAGYYEYEEFGSFYNPVTVLTQIPFVSQRSDLVNQAVLNALVKLKDQKFNAGVAIAEAEGVARMVIDASESVVKVRQFLHKGDWKGAYRRFRMYNPNYHSYPEWRKLYWDEVRHVESVRRARKIPEGWLYYHYGYKPTVDDLDAATKEIILRNTGGTNPNYYKGKVMGYAKVKYSLQGPDSVGNIIWETFEDVVESVRVNLYVSPKNDLLVRASKLGVTNPAEAIWNRIPFSFLVDYVFGVGEWLHVLDTWVGWDFGDWEESWRVVRSGKAIPSYDKTNSDGSVTSFHISPATRVRKELERVVHKTLYSPMANVRPRVKLPSANQLASILSLLATSFKRTVRP